MEMTQRCSRGMGMMRFAAALVLALCACATPSDMYRHEISRKTGCPSNEIAVTPPTATDKKGRKVTVKEGDSYGYLTPVSGCERDFLCVVSASGSAECDETRESSRQTDMRVSTDLLSVETACPKEQITVSQESEWVVGMRRAFRLTACGKPYVCSAAPGYVACKEPLADSARQAAPATPSSSAPP